MYFVFQTGNKIIYIFIFNKYNLTSNNKEKLKWLAMKEKNLTFKNI